MLVQPVAEAEVVPDVQVAVPYRSTRPSTTCRNRCRRASRATPFRAQSCPRTRTGIGRCRVGTLESVHQRGDPKRQIVRGVAAVRACSSSIATESSKFRPRNRRRCRSPTGSGQTSPGPIELVVTRRSAGRRRPDNQLAAFGHHTIVPAIEAGAHGRESNLDGCNA